MEVRWTLRLLEAFIIVYSLVFLYFAFSTQQYFLSIMPLVILIIGTMGIYKLSKEKDIPRQLFLLGGVFILMMVVIFTSASEVVADMGITLEFIIFVQIPLILAIIFIVYYLTTREEELKYKERHK